MSNTIWAVDGSFFAQRLSGIQRYSIELLAALDRIVPPGFVEIVTPPGVETPHYTNIKVVSFGTHRGGVWQQLDYPRYLRQRGAGGLATCNVIPLFVRLLDDRERVQILYFSTVGVPGIV